MLKERLTYILAALFIMLIVFIGSGLYFIRKSIDLEHQRVLIASRIGELLNRRVIIGNIDLSFYPPVSLRCENFVILEKDSDEEFFSAREVYLVLDSMPLLHREVRWKDIIISHPVLNIRRLNDGSLNISDFYSEGKDGVKELKREIAEMSFISQLSFRNGEVWFHGIDGFGRGVLWGLKGMKFYVKKEKNQSEIFISGSAHLSDAPEDTILKIRGKVSHPSGNLDIAKFDMDVVFSLNSFDIKWISYYVSKMMQPLLEMRGKGEAEVAFKGNPFSLFSCTFNGQFSNFSAEGNGFSFASSNQKVFIKFAFRKIDDTKSRIDSLEVKDKNLRFVADADGVKGSSGWLWRWRFYADEFPLKIFLTTLKLSSLEKEPFLSIKKSLVDGSMKINSLVVNYGQNGIKVQSCDIEIIKSVFDMGRDYEPLINVNGRIIGKDGVSRVSLAGLWGRSNIEEFTVLIPNKGSSEISFSLRSTFPLQELKHLLNHKLFPEELHKIGNALPSMEGSGRGSFKLDIKSRKKLYVYRGEIEVGNGRVSFSFLPLMLTDIKGVLVFNNTSLDFKNGHALYGSTPIEGYLMVRRIGDQFQLKKIGISIKNGFIKDLVEFSRYLKRYRSSGNFSGNIEWTRLPRNDYSIFGEVNFSKVGFTSDLSNNSEPSFRINGKLTFRGREGFIGNCLIDIDKEYIRGFGTFSLDSEYIFHLSLRSISINLDRIINDAFIDFIKGSEFLENIRLYMDLDFKNSSFRDVNLLNLNSLLEYNHGKLMIKKLSASIFDGNLDLSGHINFRDQSIMPWEFQGELKNGNMQKLMEIAGSEKAMGGRFSVAGVINGVNFDRETFRTLNGFLNFSMNNGFLNIGKLQIATELITYLKNFEWAKLRLPDFSQNGLIVNKMTGDFLLDRGKARTTNLTVDGKGLRITGKGEVGLYDRTVDVKLAIHPFPLMDRAIGSIPVIGRALTGGDRSIFGFSFRIKGEWSNTQISPEGEN